MKKKYLILLAGVLSILCVLLTTKRYSDKTVDTPDTSKLYECEKLTVDSIEHCRQEIPTSKFRRTADSLHLVNVCDLDGTVGVDLKYATTDNFTGKVLYEDIDGAYLRQDVAAMLVEAHRQLKRVRPDLRFLIYDAVRPLSVQRAMWEYVKDTKYSRYLAHPDRTGLHNYGAAVDLTLADSLYRPLDMGTPFDHFGKAAGITAEQELTAQGLLNEQQVQNRRLLREVMLHAGFRTVGGEWWHFNACSLREAQQRYALIEDF